MFLELPSMFLTVTETTEDTEPGIATTVITDTIAGVTILIDQGLASFSRMELITHITITIILITDIITITAIIHTTTMDMEVITATEVDMEVMYTVHHHGAADRMPVILILLRQTIIAEQEEAVKATLIV